VAKVVTLRRFAVKATFLIFLKATLCLLIISLVLCAQITVAAKQTKSQEESKLKAEEMWEQAITAKGGRERLCQVNSLLISYEETVRNFLGIVVHRGLVERLYVFPDKSWAWDDGLPPPFVLTVNMFNLERKINCTMYDGVASPKCTEPKDAASFFNQSEGLGRAQHLYLLETKWVKPVPIRVTNDLIGRKRVDVIQTEVDARRVDYYLDRKTHLPQRVIRFFESGRGWETYNFSDYISINGIQLPSVQKQGKISFQINPAYDESIFIHPPSIEAGSNAWRLDNR
jgi:hypothetical protein